MKDNFYTLEKLGAPLFSSRSAEIYPWRGNTLLKLFFEDYDPELTLIEEVNTIETFDKGVSKVNCYGHIWIENRVGLIIEKIEGDTLLNQISADVAFVDTASDIQAELQAKLHQTHSTKIRSYKELVWTALNSKPLDFLTEAERNFVTDKINSLPDKDSILHLDYYTGNIMSVGADDASIIDWFTAAYGDPAADVATTTYLCNEGEMVPGLSEEEAAVLEGLRIRNYERYINRYKELTGMTDEEIAAWRLPVMIVRLGIWNIASEVPALQEKIRAAIHA